MNRTDALDILHRILPVWEGSHIVNWVSLDYLGSQAVTDYRSYKIKMACTLDNQSRKFLKPILEMKKLGLREENGFVIIFSLN